MWLIIGAFVFVMWIAPALVGAKDITAQNAVRTLAIYFIGFMAFMIAAIALWRRIERNLEAAQDSQITERFTRAVDLLGSDKIETRLGGIYALERITRDSERDHWTIMETLTAFIRVHRPWREVFDQSAESAALPTDIQVILTVIGRRGLTYQHGEDQRLNLAGTDLRLALLPGAHLEGVQLSLAHLESSRLQGAWLRDADLSGACLTDADLANAVMANADLAGAVLKDATLCGVNLVDAKLMKANFEGCNLGQADLHGVDARSANFENADLSEVNFTGANLRHANLAGANFHGTVLCQADLRFARGITEQQLAEAVTDTTTLLPEHLRQEEQARV
jgi:uncharacterized protein YjbI with pentapeptide repeats